MEMDDISVDEPKVPSKSKVSDFVRELKGRIRYVSLCNNTSFDASLLPVVAATSSKEMAPRSPSCPEFNQLRKRAEMPHDSKSYETVEVQTDEFVVFPYEHLFSCVLPQWIVMKPEETKAKVINPYDVLDQFIQASSKKVVDSKHGDNQQQVKVLQDEIAMLHNQVLYERHRRETLGLRNRRLLGKTKSSRVLEEENTALVRKCF